MVKCSFCLFGILNCLVRLWTSRWSVLLHTASPDLSPPCIAALISLFLQFHGFFFIDAIMGLGCSTFRMHVEIFLDILSSQILFKQRTSRGLEKVKHICSRPSAQSLCHIGHRHCYSGLSPWSSLMDIPVVVSSPLWRPNQVDLWQHPCAYIPVHKCLCISVAAALAIECCAKKNYALVSFCMGLGAF